MNLRREGGKRWVELALSCQTSAVLANWIKTCVHKQSSSASSGDIEFCPSPDILSHFFKRDLPVGKIFLTLRMKMLMLLGLQKPLRDTGSRSVYGKLTE